MAAWRGPWQHGAVMGGLIDDVVLLDNYTEVDELFDAASAPRTRTHAPVHTRARARTHARPYTCARTYTCARAHMRARTRAHTQARTRAGR
jgi:hypothetical protein